MDVYYTDQDDRPSLPPSAVTVGSFDGVHLGHRYLLKTLCTLARKQGLAPTVVTFEPHPRQFFFPEHPPNLLTPTPVKLDLLDAAGVTAVHVVTFDKALANLPRDRFLEDILLKRCAARAILLGHDFRFGNNADGDFDFLQETLSGRDILLQQVPPLFHKGERVSSTLIRERILQGDLKEAEAFLGRPYSIAGTVVSGRAIGTELGFPTANLHPGPYVVPAQGVYAAHVRAGQASHIAAVNIGIAPTIRQQDVTIEAHLLDFKGNLRGQPIEVIFHKRLRGERKFASHDALRNAIREDICKVIQFFQEDADLAQDRSPASQ